MKISELTPGMAVMYGPRKSLTAGSDDGVFKTVVVDIGPYTDVIGPCGELQVAVIPGSTKRRVVIAWPSAAKQSYSSRNRRHGPVTIDSTTTWSQRSVTGEFLMSLAEYEVKRFPVLELQAMQAQYHSTLEEARQKVRDAVREDLADVGIVLPDDASIQVGRYLYDDGNPRLTITLEDSTVKALVGQGAKKRLRELAKLYRNPPKCVR